MAKTFSVWIARRYPNGQSKSGRTRWKTEAVKFQKEVNEGDRVMVFWKTADGKTGEKMMPSPYRAGFKEAATYRDKKTTELATLQEAVPEGKTAWKAFRTEFEKDKLQGTGSERKADLTVRDYNSLLNRVESILAPKCVEDLDDKGVANFRSKLMSQKAKQAKDGKLSPGSIAKNIRYLKAVLSYARRKGYRVANHVESVKTWPSDTRFFPDEALRKIFAVIDSAQRPALDAPYSCSAWWEGFLWIQRSNGLRLSEALNLKWEDVSLDQATLHIPFQKNGQATTLPLSEQTVSYLRKLVDLGETHVFPTGGLHEKSLYEEFHRLQALAGVHLRCLLASRDADHVCTPSCSFFGFHSLRKAFCSINAQNGMPLEVLCALARHSSVSVTQKYYLDAEALRLNAAGTLADPVFNTEEPAA
ncbi:tyrosine-type recombinase/integrase [Bremerella sp. P1]|uniref:tyrosine-type recombinase/integrase n=1 Tax=Bremerella sp. P1 TaxID=3026424 RepID=UPI002367E27F|nr:site-specific integrase [Bremerella sp. P1]WDI42110.1 site-specific integrase [Bremerella sp. P1]